VRTISLGVHHGAISIRSSAHAFERIGQCASQTGKTRPRFSGLSQAQMRQDCWSKPPGEPCQRKDGKPRGLERTVTGHGGRVECASRIPRLPGI
jgi:hypothetical protein